MSHLSLEVVGHLWSGPEAGYRYTVPEGVLAENVIANPSRFAGDFQSVSDFQLVRCFTTFEYEGKTQRRIESETVLRRFRSGTMARRFRRLVGA